MIGWVPRHIRPNLIRMALALPSPKKLAEWVLDAPQEIEPWQGIGGMRAWS